MYKELSRRHLSNSLYLVLESFFEGISAKRDSLSKELDLEFVDYNDISQEILAENLIYEYIFPRKTYIFAPVFRVAEPPTGSSILLDIKNKSGDSILSKYAEIKPGETTSTSPEILLSKYEAFERISFDVIQSGAIYGGSELSFSCKTICLI